MKSQSSSDTLPFLEKPGPLRIYGLYADTASHLLSMEVLKNLARNCLPVCPLEPVWWSFEMVESAGGPESAAEAAMDADMLWCAMPAFDHVPEAVKNCLHAWSTRPGKDEGALVVLLRCPSDYDIERSPARICLSQLALANDIKLFVGRFDRDYGALIKSAPGKPVQKVGKPSLSGSEKGQMRLGLNE